MSSDIFSVVFLVITLINFAVSSLYLAGSSKYTRSRVNFGLVAAGSLLGFGLYHIWLGGIFGVNFPIYISSLIWPTVNDSPRPENALNWERLSMVFADPVFVVICNIALLRFFGRKRNITS